MGNLSSMILDCEVLVYSSSTLKTALISFWWYSNTYLPIVKAALEIHQAMKLLTWLNRNMGRSREGTHLFHGSKMFFWKGLERDPEISWRISKEGHLFDLKSWSAFFSGRKTFTWNVSRIQPNYMYYKWRSNASTHRSGMPGDQGIS